MRRSTVVFLLLGCTVVAALVLSWRAGPGRVQAPPRAGGPAGAPARGVDLARADRQRVQVPTVTLNVRALERFVAPPASVPLAVRPNGAPLLGRVIAGAGAGFDVDAQPRGAALLEIEDGDRRLLRVASLGEPQPSPALTIGARVTMVGVVLDDRGQPLSGASVWFGERSADRSQRLFRTDEQGAFAADVPAGAGVPFVVRASGYASTWRAISAPVGVGGASRRSDALRVMLEPASTIHLQVAGRAVEIDRARAYVLPGVDAISSGVARWPFFAQALDGGYAIDADGRAVISGFLSQPLQLAAVNWCQSPSPRLNGQLAKWQTGKEPSQQ